MFLVLLRILDPRWGLNRARRRTAAALRDGQSTAPPRGWALSGTLVVAAVALASGVAQGADWPDSRKLDPIVYRADFKLDALAFDFQEITALGRELRRTLGIPAPREPVEVYLFGTQAAYARHLRSVLGQAPDRRAMYVKAAGRGRVYVYVSDELATDLRHECTHALLHAALRDAPLWLDEGLAEYFEVPADQRAFDNPHLGALLRSNIAWEYAPPLAELESRRDLGELTPDDYRHAWAWVHFMFHGPQAGHEELVEYLAELDHRGSPGLLGPRLRGRIPDLERQFLLHFKRWERKSAPSTSDTD